MQCDIIHGSITMKQHAILKKKKKKKSNIFPLKVRKLLHTFFNTFTTDLHTCISRHKLIK